MRKWKRPLVSGALLVSSCLVGALSCVEPQVTIDVDLQNPTGVVVAGTKQKRLFVANAGNGALQALRLGDSLEDMSCLLYTSPSPRD